MTEISNLRLENDKFIQHQNAKQKLQYHVKIKQENNDLKEEIKAVKEELLKHQVKSQDVFRWHVVFTLQVSHHYRYYL